MSGEVKGQSEESPFLVDAIKISVKDKEKQEEKDTETRHENKDITSGFWIFKGPLLQRCATETTYVAIYGIAGLILAMSFTYFNGTMTTLEKRYKIPTKIFGVITIGNDITAMIGSVFVGYYLQKVHRPRWMALGCLITVTFSLMNLCLHFIYGAGADALSLTHEFGNLKDINGNVTISKSSQKFCTSEDSTCLTDTDSWAPIIILFIAQLILGIGSSIYWITGIAYMDDNSKKSRAPAMLTFSTCIRMLGPAGGYLLASMCLKMYIEPSLSPVIMPEDPRWLGAWWIGYIVLAICTILIAFVISLFPKELPSSKARRLKLAKANEKDPNEHQDLSLQNMWKSSKDLLNNKLYLYNLYASIVYFFGYNVYWNFSQKYIEIQYRQSASGASMATGPVALGFSAVGVLLSGYVLSKYKPKARSIAVWNVVVDFLTVAGIVCYAFIGCKASDQLGSMATTSECSAACHCEYVHYAPICSPNNVTYISACHAGCTGKSKDLQGHTMYTGCGCITGLNSTEISGDISHMLTALDGPCPVDCSKQFYTFLVVMCFLKFVGAFGKSGSFLLTLRCVPPDQKSFGLGLHGMICSLFAFIPSPIFFGWLIDKYCLLWGKTCGNQGNCWLYDTQALRYVLNFTAGAFLLAGGLFNIFVWYYAKDLQIFDDNEKKTTEDNYLNDDRNALQLKIRKEKQ
ncbi:solute carrier organic anion transporter family member 74D-like [Drosophila innubila]|uniref:solute carrier organic anion transporter family member 74D-like n=1 Tax=Drosophila innubila TaxID=198719 RepID=UPI00148C6D63|nr:solute carrier organic anion transporter family member 74D-like [Drosophila innubila]